MHSDCESKFHEFKKSNTELEFEVNKHLNYIEELKAGYYDQIKELKKQKKITQKLVNKKLQLLETKNCELKDQVMILRNELEVERKEKDHEIKKEKDRLSKEFYDKTALITRNASNINSENFYLKDKIKSFHILYDDLKNKLKIQESETGQQCKRCVIGYKEVEKE